MSVATTARVVYVWRHPAAQGVAGRCIGRTDVAVDRRRIKRLAHRIRRHARRDNLPRLILTSPLRRSADVGRLLAAWGWRHCVDPRLAELDFGSWDGLPWREIEAAAVDAWCSDFLRHAPGGGESLESLLVRCRHFVDDAVHGPVRCVVGHAGWINAARWLAGRHPSPPTAAEWPAAVEPGALVVLSSSRPLPVGQAAA